MSALCRFVFVDHPTRRPHWDAHATQARSDTLTPLDPLPLAGWDVSPLSCVYQIGAGPCALADALPALARMQACKCRLGYARTQDHVWAVVERKERGPVDIAAMQRDLDMLLRAAFPPAEDETPWPAPVCAPAESAADPRAHAAMPPGLRAVMVVEDETMVRSLCVRMLAPHFLVFETGDSLDALALADLVPFPIHLLVTDVSLPRMDGIALARRWLKRDPDARALLLSGNPHAAADAPEFPFVQKPFFGDELVRTLQHLAQTVETAGVP